MVHKTYLEGYSSLDDAAQELSSSPVNVQLGIIKGIADECKRQVRSDYVAGKRSLALTTENAAAHLDEFLLKNRAVRYHDSKQFVSFFNHAGKEIMDLRYDALYDFLDLYIQKTSLRKAQHLESASFLFKEAWKKDTPSWWKRKYASDSI